MQNFSLKLKKGFGIIEVLIASTIIAVIIGAVGVAGSSSLKASTYMHERAQATYLAQEGVEVVRNIRDSYWIDGDNTTNWETLKAFDGDKSLKLDPTSDKWSVADLGLGESKINIDGSEYTRTVKFESVGDLIPAVAGSNLESSKESNSIKITVNISWQNNVSGISISEILTNWRPNY